MAKVTFSPDLDKVLVEGLVHSVIVIDYLDDAAVLRYEDYAVLRLVHRDGSLPLWDSHYCRAIDWAKRYADGMI